MFYFESYYNNILRREFLTKYRYCNVYQLPKLERIILSFDLSQVSLRTILPLLSALLLISSHKPKVVVSKRISVVLRVKSGLPVGCKVNLYKRSKLIFLEKLVFSILPRLKELDLVLNGNNVFFSLSNLFVFKEIEKEYEHFLDLPKLNLNLVFKASVQEEVVDFLRIFRFPIS